MSQPLLQVRELLMQFQGLTALDRVSFDVHGGAITSLMGPNGAGKTTLFNCVTGMYRPTAGRVEFDGQDITARRAHDIARCGIARTFQNLALFGGLSVLDNLLVGTYLQGRTGLLQVDLLSRAARRERSEGVAAAYQVLDYLGLTDSAHLLPGELPYGRQKQLEFGRALMQKSRLILLDEPMAGMSQSEKQAMTQLILRVRAEMNVSFLLVEHDVPVIMEVSDHIVVLDFGKKIAEGSPAAVQANSDVIAAYLGQ